MAPLIPFPTPAPFLLWLLLEEAQTRDQVALIAAHLIEHARRTEQGITCPHCMLPDT